MRLLVVADIHGNWPALQAVPEAADAVLCLGDLVTYGPSPRECIAWVRARAAYVVRGNHDTALAYNIDPQAAGSKRALAAATLALHRTLLTPADVRWLHDLPTELNLRAGDYRLHAVHATPKDPLFSYRLTPHLDDEALKKEVEDVRADLVLVGHTHLPMSRGAWTKVVVNPGSVGQPLDGDPRASYAIIEDGVAEIHRVAYDVEATVAGLGKLSLPADVAQALVNTLRTGAIGPGSSESHRH
jgi:putative phosphoesterase